MCGGDIDICTCTCTHAEITVSVQIHKTFSCLCVSLCLHVHTCVYVCVCRRLCVSVDTCVWTRVCVDTCAGQQGYQDRSQALPRPPHHPLPLPDSTASFPKDLLKHRTETGTHRARSGCRGVAYSCRCHHARGIPIPVPAVPSVPPTSPPSACPKPGTCGPPATPQQCPGFQQGSSRRGLAPTPRGCRDGP